MNTIWKRTAAILAAAFCLAAQHGNASGAAKQEAATRPGDDFAFTLKDGYVQSSDPRFYTRWMYNERLIQALAADPDPMIAANKSTVVRFEAELARVLIEGRVDRDLDAVIDRYTVENYHQMDPNIPDGRRGLSQWFKLGGMHEGSGISAPPPPIALVANYDSVAMILETPPMPSPGESKSFPGYMISVFRLRNGRLSSHYSSAMRGAYWCRIDCGKEGR